MKILILSQYYWPESFRITELVQSLLRIGCHVTVRAITGYQPAAWPELVRGMREFA